MRIKTKFLLILALLTVLFAFPALACDCGSKPSVERSLADSILVFVGRVEDQRVSPFRPEYQEIKMAVLRKYKWLDELPKKEYVLIYTPKKKAKCGLLFQNGFDYLVFANGNPSFPKVTKCSRTAVYEKATLDEERVRRITRPRL